MMQMKTLLSVFGDGNKLHRSPPLFTIASSKRNYISSSSNSIRRGPLLTKKKSCTPMTRTMCRHFATTNSMNRSTLQQQIGKQQQYQQNPKHHTLRQQYRSKVPIYILSFISLYTFGIYVHFDDTNYYYFYPLPFALDVGVGPSMLPTIGSGSSTATEDPSSPGGSVYLRDCWSHRVIWFNLDHLWKCITAKTTTTNEKHNNSIKRPWQKGDIVTIYNPYTKSIVTKRIIGTSGDTINVFGEYAHEFYEHNRKRKHNSNPSIDNANADEMNTELWGVPYDGRFDVPYCKRILQSKQQKEVSALSCKEATTMTTIVVPTNHVWLEGDNPLHSTDSRHYGPIPEMAIRGRLVLRWPRVRLWPIMMDGEEKDDIEAVANLKRPEPPTFIK